MHSSTASECVRALHDCQQHMQQQWCAAGQQQHSQRAQHLPECSVQWHLSTVAKQHEGPLHTEHQLHQHCKRLHQATRQQLTQTSPARTSQQHPSPQLYMLHEQMARLLTAAQQHQLQQEQWQQHAQRDQAVTAEQQQHKWHTPLPVAHQSQQAQLHSTCHHQHSGSVSRLQQLEMEGPMAQLQHQPVLAQVHQQLAHHSLQQQQQALLQLVGDKQISPLLVQQQQQAAARGGRAEEVHEHSEQEQQQQQQIHQCPGEMTYSSEQQHSLSRMRRQPMLLRRHTTSRPVKRLHAGIGRRWTSPRSRLFQSSSRTCAAEVLLQDRSSESGPSCGSNATTTESCQHQDGVQRASTVDLKQLQQQAQQQHSLAAPVSQQSPHVEEQVKLAVAACDAELTTPVKSLLDAASKACNSASPAAAVDGRGAASPSMDASPARVKCLVNQLEQRLSILQSLLHSPVDPEPLQQQQQCQADGVHHIMQQDKSNPQQEQQQQELQQLQHQAAFSTLVKSCQLRHCILGSPAYSDYSTAAAASSCCSDESAGSVAVLDATTQTPPSVKCRTSISSSTSSKLRTVSCQVGGSRSSGKSPAALMLEAKCSQGPQNGIAHSEPDNTQYCGAALYQQKGGGQQQCEPSSVGRLAAVAPAGSVHNLSTGRVNMCGKVPGAKENVNSSSSTGGLLAFAANSGNVLTAAGGSSSNQQQGASRVITSSSNSTRLHRESDADDVTGTCRRHLSWDQENAKTVQQTTPAAAAVAAEQRASAMVQQRQFSSCKDGQTAAVIKFSSRCHSGMASIAPVMPDAAGSDNLPQAKHRRQQCTSLNLSRGGAAVLRADECSEGLVFALLLSSKKPVKD